MVRIIGTHGKYDQRSLWKFICIVNPFNAAFRAGERRAWRQLGPTYPAASERPRDSTPGGQPIVSATAEDTRSLWQGIQTITDYKPPTTDLWQAPSPCWTRLNAFFARFEAQNSTTAQKTPPPPNDQVMTLSPDSVRRSLSRINARKAPGPDNIPGHVLRGLLQSHSYSHEVLWTASHATHQVCPPPPPPPWTPSSLHIVQPLDRWCHRHCPPPSPHMSGCCS